MAPILEKKFVMKNIAVGRAKRTVGGFLHRIGAEVTEVRRRTFTNFPEIIHFENYKFVPFSYRFGANVAELARRTC